MTLLNKIDGMNIIYTLDTRLMKMRFGVKPGKTSLLRKEEGAAVGGDGRGCLRWLVASVCDQFWDRVPDGSLFLSYDRFFLNRWMLQ